MRVLMVGFQWSRGGGIENVAVETVRALRSLGADVEVWSAHQSGAIEGWGQVAIGLAPKTRLLASAYHRYIWRRALASRMAAAGGEFDLVLVSHAHLLPPIREGMDRSGTTARCWCWAHGIEVWSAGGTEVAHALAWADRVVAVSDFTARRIRAWVSPERVIVIHNPVDTDVFTPSPTPRQSADDLLIVGRLSTAERYKGHHLLIRTLPDLEASIGRPARLRIVGDGDLRPELETMAEELGVTDRVEFTGRLPLRSLIDAYRRCAAFIMPSKVEKRGSEWTGEGLGIVYVEAQSCGRPAIVSNAGGAPETVLDGETGLVVDPSDSSSVVEAAALLLNDPARADRMGMRARSWAVDEFSIPRFRSRISQVLDHDL